MADDYCSRGSAANDNVLYVYTGGTVSIAGTISGWTAPLGILGSNFNGGSNLIDFGGMKDRGVTNEITRITWTADANGNKFDISPVFDYVEQKWLNKQCINIMIGNPNVNKVRFGLANLNAESLSSSKDNPKTWSLSFTGNGEPEVSETIPEPATVTTTAGSAIASSSFVSGGNVTDTGGYSRYDVKRGIVYGTTADPVIGVDTKIESAIVSGTGAYTLSVTGLTTATEYHVRAYVTNPLGTTYGDDVTVTTI